MFFSFGFGRSPKGDPSAMGDFEQRDNAARQLYALLGMRYIGLRAAWRTADLIQAGIDDHLSSKAKANLADLKQRNPELLDSLLADILD